MEKLSKQIATGENLVQLFVNSLTNLTSMYKAKHIAESKETDLYSSLNSINPNNGVFISSEDISPDISDQFVKQSVDAHLSKVQSEQISHATLNEIKFLESETKYTYIGRRVIIKILDKNSDVVDAVMFDKSTNQYRVSKYNSKIIKGKIQDISFENNLLIIKPSFIARSIVPNRVFIHIYVLNLEEMKPSISIQIK